MGGLLRCTCRKRGRAQSRAPGDSRRRPARARRPRGNPRRVGRSALGSRRWALQQAYRRGSRRELAGGCREGRSAGGREGVPLRTTEGPSCWGRTRHSCWGSWEAGAHLLQGVAASFPLLQQRLRQTEAAEGERQEGRSVLEVAAADVGNAFPLRQGDEQTRKLPQTPACHRQQRSSRLPTVQFTSFFLFSSLSASARPQLAGVRTQTQPAPPCRGHRCEGNAGR